MCYLCDLCGARKKSRKPKLAIRQTVTVRSPSGTVYPIRLTKQFCRGCVANMRLFSNKTGREAVYGVKVR